MDDAFDVMLGGPGDKAHNNLLVEGVDIIVPVEMDLDGDPLQDDEVWLCSVDGRPRRVLLSSSPDVERNEEKRLFYYGFRNVPFGVYNVTVRVGGKSYDTVRGLIVRRTGVFLGKERLPNQWTEKRSPPPPAEAPPPANVAPEDEVAALLPQDESRYLDQEDV